jgi:hypothetical protein
MRNFPLQIAVLKVLHQLTWILLYIFFSIVEGGGREKGTGDGKDMGLHQ